MTQRLLIIGNGMASVRLVEALLASAPGLFTITVVGAEIRPGYNRVLLSALLAQDVTPDDVILRDAGWYADNGVELITGDAVSGLDAETRLATLASGRHLPFDICVFATGSDAIRLPVPGMDKQGVITFRDLQDVALMEEAVASAAKIAVIGGGLLGIEAACGLAKRGADVTLVHVMDRLMERQLDARAAAMLKRAIERKGVKVLLNAQTKSVTGDATATGLAFADDSVLEASLVICAIGIRPNAALAKAAGLEVNRGIIVDDGMATSIPGIHAIGECAEHRGIAYGLIEPAYAQAAVLAARLAGEARAFEGMVLATNLKVSGVPVFSAGAFMGGDGTDTVVFEERLRGHYRKLVFTGDKLTGCVLVGDADDGLWYLDLIRSGVDISAMRRDLIHGRSFAEPAIGAAA
jgi:nitrite reductase (NADH) large subunit